MSATFLPLDGPLRRSPSGGERITQHPFSPKRNEGVKAGLAGAYLKNNPSAVQRESSEAGDDSEELCDHCYEAQFDRRHLRHWQKLSGRMHPPHEMPRR